MLLAVLVDKTASSAYTMTWRQTGGRRMCGHTFRVANSRMRKKVAYSSFQLNS